MGDLTKLPVAKLAGELTAKRVSSLEVTDAYIAKIRETEGDVRAYITVTEEAARQAAKAIDDKRVQGDTLPPLSGVPGAIKDNICTRGTKTTCASKMLSEFVPPYNAEVMDRLNAQGFVMLGKNNMDEFAMGGTTENSWYYPTKNPRDLSRVPGGSSGGGAAAVAASSCAFSLGSDTGGSIRQPAAFCGVVGMKPTYGTVSRRGLVAFASSLDQIGPLTKTVEDSALVLNAIAGHDAKDATSVAREYGDFGRDLHRGVKGLRVALPKEYFGEGLAPDIQAAIFAMAKKLEGEGAQIVQTSMPSIGAALPAYYILSSAEASSNLARFDGVKYGYRAEGCDTIEELYRKTRSEGFGPEVKRRIMLGTFALSAGYFDAYYNKAGQVRTLISRDFDRIFETCDCILSPVAPTTAYKLGEKTDDPVQMYLGDIYTVPINIAGVPALSLPVGRDSKGLPIGAQLIGPAFSEPVLYRVGAACETLLDGGAEQ